MPIGLPPRNNAHRRARAALSAVLAKRESTFLDGDYRTSRLDQNLIDAITLGQLKHVTAQIEMGDGGELRPQGKERPRHRPPMHSAFSSAALAVNSFAPWIGCEESLVLG